jgi:bacterioferritin
MKSNAKILDSLNGLLADELTAISQYMVHSEMCANWGYQRLHDAVEKRAIDEMKHAETLIGRILFLEGKPIVTKLNKIMIGEKVPGQLENDHGAEDMAIENYNKAIAVMAELGDHGTKILLEGILKEEEAHIDTIEEQLDQLKQMGVENYLLGQRG